MITFAALEKWISKPLVAKQLMALLLFMPLLLSGCSSTPSSPATIASHSFKPQHPVYKGNSLHKRLQNHYLAWKGTPYKIGGNGKNGVDCSGFVHITFKKALGVKVPRSTKLLAKTGKEIASKQLTTGDLVFFKTGISKRHVGIYLSNGEFIHASTSRGVMKSSLKSPYWSKHYWKSVRMLSL